MSQEVFAAIVGSCLVLIGTALGFMINKVLSMDTRLVRIETFFDLMGKNLATALHSPTTPEFDLLAEKYSAHFDLSWDEWKRFKEICLDLQKHDSPHPHKISGYAVLAALCEHKLRLPSYGRRESARV